MSEDAIAAIARRRSKSLTAIVQGEIERMILSGELKSGERLNEQALAARLGVSRGPVREATRALEHAGLVTSIPNHGVFVRQIEPIEISEIYDVRAVVFGFACMRLARIATPEQVALLRALIEAMGRAIDAGDASTYYQLNLEFHDRMMEFADHAKARQTYEGLIKETHLTRQRSLVAPGRMRESNAEHTAMIDAIAAGDAELARQRGEAHCLGGRRRWVESGKE